MQQDTIIPQLTQQETKIDNLYNELGNFLEKLTEFYKYYTLFATYVQPLKSGQILEEVTAVVNRIILLRESLKLLRFCNTRGQLINVENYQNTENRNSEKYNPKIINCLSKDPMTLPIIDLDLMTQLNTNTEHNNEQFSSTYSY